ncbi:MAG TPA: tetratricopeptide repeat protein [Opitutaceae bacterium]|jgi:hypothetical protein
MDTSAVSLSVVPAERSFFLGAPIPATVAVTNNSGDNIVFENMNPYSVVVTDGSGKVLFDPTTRMIFTGGYIRKVVSPGMTKEFPVDLGLYIETLTPGTYSVRLAIRRTSEPAWPDYPAPVEFAVKLEMPTAGEAAEVIASDMKQRRGFVRLLPPIYVAPLEKFAAEGDGSAFEGLRQVPSKEATRAMVDVLSNETDPRRLDAEATGLILRLPSLNHPTFAPPPLGGVPLDTVWDDDAKNKARQLAHVLLRSPEARLRMDGAQLLGTLGLASDADELTQAGLEALGADRGDVPGPWQPDQLNVGAFTSALSSLAKRGIIVPGDPKADPLWALVTFDSYGPGKGRPQGWAELVRQWFGSPIPALRAAAVSSIPHPPPASFAGLLAKAKDDPAETVRRSALFVTEHKVIIGRGSPLAPLPPVVIQIQGNTAKMVTSSAQWQVEAYSALIAKYPQNADNYDNRGVAKCDLGQPDSAISDFDTAIRLRPGLAAAYNNRGLAHAAKGDAAAAISDYTAALSIDPKMAEAYFNRGLRYAAARQYDDAIRDFSAAIPLDPDYAPAFGQRAELERAEGKTKLAEADERHANALDSNWRDVKGRPRIQAGG